MKKKKLIKLIITWCLIICTTITGCSMFDDEKSSGSSKRKNEGYFDIESLIISAFDLDDRDGIAYWEPEETQEIETREPQTESVSEEQPSTEQLTTEAVTTETVETEPATTETATTEVSVTQEAQKSEGGHTIMIYMVGSDLESEYGAATYDIEEMLAAGADTKVNNIILYAGGASKWYLDDLKRNTDNIIVLDKNGYNVVETTELQNMGAADTLSDFINFCMNNYSAEKYSLVLWNHGAGPVLGYGLDENTNDLLSLEEIGKALKNSVGARGERLEWLGFDACLMSSMEVAEVVAPYANYLIASQETEPGWGWYYNFLECLADENYTDEELRNAIIDTYMEYGRLVFDNRPSAYTDLTLSCIDLNKYQAAEDALNMYFAQLDASMSTKIYSSIVRGRTQAREFGVYTTSYDYGLVDVIHLLEQLPKSDLREAAIAAVDEMIVYSDTNMENAHGISICYPYSTEEDYTQAYMKIRKEIGFADSYGEFLENFYAIKNGESLVHTWEFRDSATGINTIAAGKEGDADVSDVSLQLTPEQQENFAGAKYIILCNVQGAGYKISEDTPRPEDMYILIHLGADVEMDLNGKLHAYYGNQAMYVHDLTEDTYSNIPMTLYEKERTEKEVRYTTFGVLQDLGDMGNGWKVDSAEIQIVVNEEYPNGTIRYAIPIEAEESVVSGGKQLIELNNYDYMSIAPSARYYTEGENGEMINFYDWEETGWFMGFDVNLQNEYCLEYRPLENPENYMCIFVIEDLQGNVSYSNMIPLK